MAVSAFTPTTATTTVVPRSTLTPFLRVRTRIRRPPGVFVSAPRARALAPPPVPASIALPIPVVVPAIPPVAAVAPRGRPPPSRTTHVVVSGGTVGAAEARTMVAVLPCTTSGVIATAAFVASRARPWIASCTGLPRAAVVVGRGRRSLLPRTSVRLRNSGRAPSVALLFAFRAWPRRPLLAFRPGSRAALRAAAAPCARARLQHIREKSRSWLPVSVFSANITDAADTAATRTPATRR